MDYNPTDLAREVVFDQTLNIAALRRELAETRTALARALEELAKLQSQQAQEASARGPHGWQRRQPR